MRYLVAILSLFLVSFIGCTPVVKDIPAGYVGKVLTPSGWQKSIVEASQVDLGERNNNGTFNKLVLLEATTTVVKEMFHAAPQAGGEDDRIVVNNVPLTVDVYVRCMVPDDADGRTAIFAQMTPAPIDNPRVSGITVDAIYERFAKMDIRGGTREVFSRYKSFDEIQKNLVKINKELNDMALATFKANKVPLIMQNMQASNIKQDESVWNAENQKAAAIAQVSVIDSLGAALRRNPEYKLFKKYDTYALIGKNNPNATFNIFDGENSAGVVVGRK